LILFFADAIREVRKYAHVDVSKKEFRGSAETDALGNMRSYYAQRNLFISGFTLLFYLMIKRIMSFIEQSAYLEQTSEVATKHAETAEKTTKTLIESESCDIAVRELTLEIEDLQKERDEAVLKRNEVDDRLKDLQMEYDKVCKHLSTLENRTSEFEKDK